MMQKTDFEFELVIGEDCSTDKTREICFEYQKKHPDKIRVLWCDHNLWRNPHPAGANGRRNMAHCRGEFIALCEGDDYWIDPLKLQKQVDVMRKHPNVGFCFSNGQSFAQASNSFNKWWDRDYFEPGVIDGNEMFVRYAFGNDPAKGCGREGFLLTASLLIRKSVYDRVCRRFEIFMWRLLIADKTLILGCSLVSDGCYSPDEMVVYRRHNSGSMATSGDSIYRDSAIAKLYYSDVLCRERGFAAPSNEPILVLIYNRIFNGNPAGLSKPEIDVFHSVFKRMRMRIAQSGIKIGVRLWLFFALKRIWPLTLSLSLRNLVK